MKRDQLVQKAHKRGQTEWLHLSSVCQVIGCSILRPGLCFQTKSFMMFIKLSDADLDTTLAKAVIKHKNYNFLCDGEEW